MPFEMQRCRITVLKRTLHLDSAGGFLCLLSLGMGGYTERHHDRCGWRGHWSCVRRHSWHEASRYHHHRLPGLVQACTLQDRETGEGQFRIA